MKSFFQFLTEATPAVQQAKRLGLVGDGHGGWYDRATNEFAAKTVNGELKFYNKRQRIGTKDSSQTEQEKNISQGSYEQPAQPAQDPQMQQDPQQMPPEDPQAQTAPESAPQQPAGPPDVPKTKGTLTIAFGRFNPPTAGHQKLLDIAASVSNGEDYIIVPSRTQDGKKNPLDVDTKISFMRLMFPQHSERIMNDVNFRTIFDVLKKAHNDGYTNVQIVSGGDRVPEFEKLSNNYNGQLYQFDNINTLSAGDRDPDSEGIGGVSASKMRLAAAEGDFDAFMACLPKDIDENIAVDLFNTIRQSMNIKEGFETWEVAPKFDWKNLRENYIAEKIFQLGQLVENLNTGLIGRIIRRGTNYLICVTEDNIMFKSWIKDVMETKKYTEKKMNKKYREPGKPNTLVGTGGFLSYAKTMVPGSSYGKQFINKYRKNKS
jgi:hypothetical protein